MGLLCWLTPIGGEVVAAVAVGCGVGSVATRRAYRIDWTAVAGICAGGGHLYLALILFAISTTGL